jgi:hypothetical protein
MLPTLLVILLQANPAPPSALGFADHLLDTGDNYRAIGEYKRYLFDFPDGDRRDEAELKIGIAYLRGERYPEAALFFDLLATKAADPTRRALCLFGEADARYLQGEYGVAANGLRLLGADDAAPVEVRSRAKYLAGWAALFSHDAPGAREAFQSAGADPRFGLKARRAFADVAGLMSAVVPGAGYLYLGQPGIAAAAFAWNGLFGVGVADAAIHHLWGVTAVLAVFETMWYGGAIFGSVSGAHKYNRDAWLNYIDGLKASHDWTAEAADDPLSPADEKGP